MNARAVNKPGTAKPTAVPKLDQFRRITIKVGSSLLVDHEKGCVRRDWLAALADDVAALHGEGRDVLIVSSGSVALGRTVLGLPKGALRLEGQSGRGGRRPDRAGAALGRSARRPQGHGGADSRHLRRYGRAPALSQCAETIGRLLDLRAIPVINENDTVATRRNPLWRQ